MTNFDSAVANTRLNGGDESSFFLFLLCAFGSDGFNNGDGFDVVADGDGLDFEAIDDNDVGVDGFVAMDGALVFNVFIVLNTDWVCADDVK